MSEVENPFLPFNPTQSTPTTEPESDYAKLAEGENLLRIVPAPLSWGHWFAEQGLDPTPFIPVPKHFYFDGKRYVSTQCPRKLKRSAGCPICDASDVLRASHDQGDQDLGWDMAAKSKRLCNVLIRGKESQGIKIWELSVPMGKKPKGLTMWEKVLDVMQGSGAKNIVSPFDDGYDLVVKKLVTGPGKHGTSYTVKAAGSPSPLCPPEKMGELVDSIHDLREFRSIPSPDMIQRLLGEGEGDGAKAPQLPAGQPASSSSPAISTGQVGSMTGEDDLPF